MFFKRLAELADLADATWSFDTESKLFKAIIAGNNNEVKELLKRKIDWSRATVRSGSLLLSLAMDDDAMLKDLLEAGIPVNAKDSENIHALAYAIYKNNYYTVDLLLKHGAKVNMRFGQNQRNPIMEAVIRGVDPKIVHKLMEYGANPNAADLNNQTAISVAENQNQYLLVYLKV
ncbi:ankyrin repeat domain-containing protein [Planococcus sp. X10-3]|uniref:ankyrin repeat domain-containing protein n=1 Tax=Planococcus sp. X10-3 TaxID=3061240 RepID=UPI003BB1F3AD